MITIAELRLKKEEIEEKVKELLENFTDATTLSVKSIRVEKMYEVGKRRPIYQVEIDIDWND